MKNGSNNKRQSKFGRAVSKRGTTKRANFDASIKQSDNKSDESLNFAGIEPDDFDNQLGIYTESNSGEYGNDDGGNRGNGSGDGRGRGRGSDDGNDGSADNDTAGNRKRGRRSRRQIIEDNARELGISIEEAEILYDQERVSPRKVSARKTVSQSVDITVGLFANVLTGTAELLAMVSARPYLQLEESESKELSKASIEFFASLSPSTRKWLDKYMSQYLPAINLAKVVALIAYPRWLIFKEEQNERARQSKNQSQSQTQSNGNVDESEFADAS